ncbi:neuropeptide receptor A10 [Danaus plexippus plexippus]|uniref:Neuropeptide receptor A10 n=1 Tax=Danaus plexippus plexippus TaxID=278856 RepID=A0A212ET09_DANPL|nr:neuropeptide receptor A10 [Danaus plexippus plexippus]
MFRSEKTCNGNETIQESLLTSTVTKPSVRYKIELNEKLKPYEDDAENISPDEKPEEKPSPTEDYVKMYMFVDKSIVKIVLLVKT